MLRVLVISGNSEEFSCQSKSTLSVVTWFDSYRFSLEDNSLKVWRKQDPLLVANDNSIEILSYGDNYLIVNLNQIIRIEQQSSDTNIFLNNKRFISTGVSINTFEDFLTEYQFIRIHQNHLVNLHHMNSFVRCNAFVTLSNSDAIPVAIGNDKRIIDFLEKQSIV